MSAVRNHAIYVDRPAGSTEVTRTRPNGATHDTLLGSHWQQNPNGSLDVFAWKGGVKTLVATYPPEAWTGVQFQGSLR